LIRVEGCVKLFCVFIILSHAQILPQYIPDSTKDKARGLKKIRKGSYFEAKYISYNRRLSELMNFYNSFQYF